MAAWMASFMLLAGVPDAQWPIVWPPLVEAAADWPSVASIEDGVIVPLEVGESDCRDGVCTTARSTSRPTTKRVRRRPFQIRLFQRFRRR
jgi:hypothetical protein